MKRCALLLAILCLCPALFAQGHDAEARRITEQPSYKGYRVERPPARGGDGFDQNPGERVAGSGDSAGSSSGAGGEVRGTPQRGSRPGGRIERSSGGGSSGGGSPPTWIGGLFEVIAWGIVLIGGSIALFFIVKALLGIKWKRKPKSTKSKKAKKAAGSVETTTEEDAIEIDPQVFEDALAIAEREYREALSREDFAAATLLAYRIFWLKAGWRGCVQESDVRTWRDALRMVRATETRREVRELLPMVERVRYAEYTPARDEFTRWAEGLQRIEPTGVLR